MSDKNELIRSISKRSNKKGVEAQQIQNKLVCMPTFCVEQTYLLQGWKTGLLNFGVRLQETS